MEDIDGKGESELMQLDPGRLRELAYKEQGCLGFGSLIVQTQVFRNNFFFLIAIRAR
jgi:hypothetical protein